MTVFLQNFLNVLLKKAIDNLYVATSTFIRQHLTPHSQYVKVHSLKHGYLGVDGLTSILLGRVRGFILRRSTTI